MGPCIFTHHEFGTTCTVDKSLLLDLIFGLHMVRILRCSSTMLLHVMLNVFDWFQALLHGLRSLGKFPETRVALFGEQEVNFFEGEVLCLGVAVG